MTRQLMVLTWAAAMLYNINVTTGNDCLNWFEGSCMSNPCYNGGCCSSLDNHHFNCTCKPGWTGETCQEAEHCSGQSCLNGGTCINETNGIRCVCPDGWTGLDCSTADHCFEQSCSNGGTCVSERTSFRCYCPNGWTGQDCSTADHCFGQSCWNGGTCVSEWNSFRCYCPTGWTGQDCSTADYCFGQSCWNGGTCVSERNSFRCYCPIGWTGQDCSTADYCFGQSCSNGGTCVSEKNSFRCDCPVGWTGQDCSTAIHTTDTTTDPFFGKDCHLYQKHCSSNPCFNGGCCTSLDNDFKCTCKPGWTGETCQEEEKNECSRENTCENGGTCVGQKCTCPQGWTGNRCAADIDECAQSICKNGGRCTNIPGHYSCACASGWLGDDCQYRYPSCNHTCSLDAVILNQAIYDQNNTAQCTAAGGHAPNEDLLTVCCHLTNKRPWPKGDPVQVFNVCEEHRIPLYTPIAAFNGTSSIDDSAGIFYGCIKDKQPGFLVILQGCRDPPHLLQVDQSSPFDSNSYFVIY